MNKTFIIAEAGANHDRDKNQAYDLIDVAAKSGADAVKFQTYSSDTLYSKYTPDFAGYKNIPKLIKDIELPREWQKDLKMYCDDNGIEFMSTPFDERAVDELYDLGVKRFKIAGFEATDPRFVKYVASTGLPIIISLGIGSSDKIHFIKEWIRNVSKERITLLHANHAYPTPFEDINLGELDYLKHWISIHENMDYGLSDHTEGILTPPVAVSMGAQVIEKHYTINRKLTGPDHPFAIEPNELKDMVSNIRLVETMLGRRNGNSESESNFTMAQRSIIVKGDVKDGETITEKNITTKRPMLENSIPAIEYYDLIGKKKFNKNLKDDMILTWDDIE